MTATKTIVEKNKTRIQTQFLAEVQLGNPKTKDCRNFGICRIHPIVNESNITMCSYKSIQSIVTILDGDRIEMDFLKNTIAIPTYEKFFGGKYFLVQANFRLDFLKDKRYSIHIPIGRYLVIENNSLIKVLFS